MNSWIGPHNPKGGKEKGGVAEETHVQQYLALAALKGSAPPLQQVDLSRLSPFQMECPTSSGTACSRANCCMLSLNFVSSQSNLTNVIIFCQVRQCFACLGTGTLAPVQPTAVVDDGKAFRQQKEIDNSKSPSRAACDGKTPMKCQECDGFGVRSDSPPPIGYFQARGTRLL